MRPRKNAVSLVVTVRNDAAALGQLLTALEKQTQLPDEVIMVVASSVDRTLEVARFWKPKGIAVKVLDRPDANRAIGRNAGVEQAAGEIIVFTDAGCRPEEDWLVKITAPLSNPKVDLVSGYTAGEWHNPFEEAQVPFVLVPLAKILPHPLPATRNMAIRRSVFRKFGGFRSNLNYAEDFEFSRRLAREGIVAEFVSDAVVYWWPRADIGSFFAMIVRLTAGDLQAGIVRSGLLSMWARYLLLGILVWAFSWAGLLIYLGYLITKAESLRLSRKAQCWALLLQAVCDLAVLGGSLLGLASRCFPGENTSNAS